MAVTDADGDLSAGCMEDKRVVHGCDVSDLVADVNHNAAEAVRSIHLRHGALEDGEAGDIEAFEKDLTYALVSVACKARCD